MMYKSKLAVALKSAGKVLREFGETVYMPFGEEYSILIKNMNSVRAQVTVSIDGTDVGDGTQFVINANESVELERFIKNGNLKAGNRFKFIERSDSVEKHRGIGVEDGLIRVEFQFEKKYELTVSPPYRDVCRSPSPWDVHPYWGSNQFGTVVPQTSTSDYAVYSAQVGVVDFTLSTQEANDAGITVAGSVSDQKFESVSSFLVEAETHVIVLQMLGQTEDNVRVVKPVTVKAKPKCTTCGRTNRAAAKFCTECGTSLTIV